MGADLQGANLQKADLSETDLSNVNLSGADLREADLSETDLRAVALTGVILGDTTLCEVQLDHRTQSTPQSLRWPLKSIFGRRLIKLHVSSDAWNKHARDAHSLATICSEEGLIRQARTFTIWERHARRYEALFDRNILAWFGSWLNWQATGYGISVARVSRNMLTLLLVSTLIYLLYGIQSPGEAIPLSDLVSRPFLSESVVNAVYFSVITFTTSPPGPVWGGVSQAMATIETFLGTLLIVLLGYVLGHREQI